MWTWRYEIGELLVNLRVSSPLIYTNNNNELKLHKYSINIKLIKCEHLGTFCSLIVAIISSFEWDFPARMSRLVVLIMHSLWEEITALTDICRVSCSVGYHTGIITCLPELIRITKYISIVPFFSRCAPTREMVTTSRASLMMCAWCYICSFMSCPGRAS